jgi:NAD(P) transhydrogenase subunit alpha
VSTGLLSEISLFVLALLVGFEVISKVPSMLHTPLMSASNAIHGIVLIGVMITAAEANSAAGYILTFVAAGFGAMNVVGGYLVTDRMLEMFHKRRSAPSAQGDPAENGN